MTELFANVRNKQWDLQDLDLHSLLLLLSFQSNVSPRQPTCKGLVTLISAFTL